MTFPRLLTLGLVLSALTYLLGPAVPMLVLIVGLMVGTYFMASRAQRRPWMPLAIVALAVIVAGPALAQVAAAPETVAQATSEGTKVTWAWGATLSQYASVIGSLAFAGIMLALRQLPAQVVAILTAIRAEQILQKAIDYGVNAVQGASKDKVLEFNVGNQVLAESLQYVLDNAPAWLTKWLGGPEEIAKKIWARLNLVPEASATDVKAIADRVAG